MHLLALETSAKHLSVALFKGANLLEEINRAPDGISHSEKLLPVIDSLLKKNHVTLQDIQTIALAIGPGSFTSLRVGMATALGLAAGRIHIVGVSSLKALCFAADREACLAPVFLAGRGRVYAAVYEKKGEHLRAVVEEAGYEIPAFVSRLQPLKEKPFVFGPGADANRANFDCPILENIFPGAGAVGRLVLKGQSTPVDPSALRLNYLQEPDFGGKPKTGKQS